MTIFKDVPVLIYQQVADWISQQINSGAWPEHFQLPSEFDLAAQLGVSRGTIRKAISDLIKKGGLIVIHGRGTFVSSQTLEQPLADQLIAFSEDLIQKGVPFETQVVEQKLITPPQKIALLLSLENEKIFFLKRLRLINGKPIVLFENYIVSHHCPGIELIDFSKERVFQTLEQTYGIELGWGWRTFQAKTASDEIAALLQAAPCDPVMYMEQLVRQKDGDPIEYSNLWLKGDSFRLSAIVKRDKSVTIPQSSLHLINT
jgi:DNA-binding GntR family transcriptional regulator